VGIAPTGASSVLNTIIFYRPGQELCRLGIDLPVGQLETHGRKIVQELQGVPT
jgi:K+-sensing histidine kinase KdpD